QISNLKLYTLSLVFFALGLMSKPMVVTLPFTLLLLDFWPLGRLKLDWRLVWEKLPFFAMSAASCFLTFRVQKSSGAMTIFEQLPLRLRLDNALVAYARYLEK